MSGQHITAIGSDAEHKERNRSRAVPATDYLWSRTASHKRGLGEVASCDFGENCRGGYDFPELQSDRSQYPTFNRQRDITFCDLTGTGDSGHSHRSSCDKRARQPARCRHEIDSAKLQEPVDRCGTPEATSRGDMILTDGKNPSRNGEGGLRCHHCHRSINSFVADRMTAGLYVHQCVVLMEREPIWVRSRSGWKWREETHRVDQP